MKGKIPPRRNETCKQTEKDKSIERSGNEGTEDLEDSSTGNEIRSHQLPVRSALRSPNSPPKRPCGPVVFGANSRRTISPIRKTSNKPGVTMAYLPTVAQPMVPAVYYHNHRFPVILYGHHHPNMGYISHAEPSSGNFCRAYTKQGPSKGSLSQEKMSINPNVGMRHNYGSRLAGKTNLGESKSSSHASIHQGHKINGNSQRPSHGNRPISGHFISNKPPRQRQMVNQDNDRTAPPGETYNPASDPNETYVVMKNSVPSRKVTTSRTFNHIAEKNSLSNFL